MVLWYVLAGIFSNLLIGLIAYKKRALTFPSGFLAAAIVGLTIFLASWRIWVTLAIFFVTSSLLSRFRENDPIKKSAISFAEKGSQRDPVQVFANGGAAFIFSFVALVMFGLDVPITVPLVVGAVGSLAASTADTWSTEIGTSSKTDPVLVFKPWKRVPRGTSGGITLLGTVASFFGAFTIGLVFVFLGTFALQHLFLISIAGFTGGLIDSLLGGTIQAVYQCSVCQKETERLFHCGASTRQIKGIGWFNNDVVNFIASLSAGVISFIVAFTLV